jgi:hypothetical protein
MCFISYLCHHMVYQCCGAVCGKRASCWMHNVIGETESFKVLISHWAQQPKGTHKQTCHIWYTMAKLTEMQPCSQDSKQGSIIIKGCSCERPDWDLDDSYGLDNYCLARHPACKWGQWPPPDIMMQGKPFKYDVILCADVCWQLCLCLRS